MSDFGFYFIEGWKHIISADAIDHQLFILALAVIYKLEDWKKVVILVTAFTIGHSVTLALSVFDVLRLPTALVEFLIPVTIMLTAAWNIFGTRKNKRINNNYYLALFFGLIHGMGFANSIRMMLASDQSIGMGLLGFNLGLEAGQIVVVFILLLIARFLLNFLKIPQRIYIFVISTTTLIISTIMAINRWPQLF